MKRFRLPDAKLVKYFQIQPKWGPIGEITYLRTYARPLISCPKRIQELAAEEGIENFETWPLTCIRVVEGVYEIQRKWCAENKRPWNKAKATHSALTMLRLMFDFKFLPPGRGLWAMGTEMVDVKGGAVLNNCAFTSTKEIAADFAKPFCFLMDMSMLGVGVGFDTSGSGTVTQVLPKEMPSYPHMTVEDSREGWVKAVRYQLCSVVLYGTPVMFDFSQVRPAGSPIEGFGGTASGPGPLEQLLEAIPEILSTPGKPITSTQIVDLMNAIGRCVVSGNVRRSAEIALGSPDDSDFMSLKVDPSSERNQKWGWASNNSVIAKNNQKCDFMGAASGSGELPGILWLDRAREFGRMKDQPNWADTRAGGTNPCGEQTLEDKELCCLVETFPSLHDSYYEYQKTLKYAYLYAKTVTLVPTHNPQTNEVIKRNRRIGCSMTGVVQAIEKHGRSSFLNWCDSGYNYLKALDDRYSSWFEVPRSIKITSIKPSGTVSLLPGVSAGMHWPYSEYYNRVIRFASDSPYVGHLRNSGYRCVDLAPGEPNTTAVYFPVRASCSRGEEEISIWEQALLAADLQYYWADNQVSCTIKYKEHEAKDVQRVCEILGPRLKSISFLKHSDHGFSHAPYQRITEAEYLEYSMRLNEMNQVNRGFVAGHEADEKFCDGEACEISYPAKQDLDKQSELVKTNCYDS